MNALRRRITGLTLSVTIVLQLVLVPVVGWAQPLRNPFDPAFFQNASVLEINYYLSQMDTDELAATLKLLRATQVVKAQYVGNVHGGSLMTGSIRGMVNSLGDPYSVYMDPKMYSELMLETKGSFGGVGIVLGVREKVLTVVSPIEGTPAEAAGVQSGDQILKINGQDTKDMALDEAVSRIRGPEGSQVTLTLQRSGQEAKEYSLTRATIILKSVSGKMLEGTIGYIRLSMFSETTGKDFKEKMEELTDAGMKSMILDLRNNPGGLINESIKVANLLIPAGPVVHVIGKDGTRETSSSQMEKDPIPLVVLINGGSASASEIVAGAIQDSGVGKLVGHKSFGKGSVQRIVPLDKDSALKITIAEYHTPKDRSIHGKGIEPDIIVEMPKDKESKADPQLDKALELLRNRS